MSLFIERKELDAIKDKIVIEKVFDGKVNVENMHYDTRTELSKLVSYFVFEKERLCRLLKKNPEMTRDCLEYFGEYVTHETRFFNSQNSDEKVKFSGLLEKYMLEIKNAGATQ